MERLRSYDLETGDIVWESEGLTMNPIPSPVFADGIMIATSGFRGNDLKAVRLSGARGDITGSDAIVWSLDRDTPYVPSPVLYDGIVYLLKTNSPESYPLLTPRRASCTINCNGCRGCPTFSPPPLPHRGGCIL